MTQSAPNTKALTSRGGGWPRWGHPAPWQAPVTNGTALEKARAASGASKTCEEGRGCRRSLSCCRGPQEPPLPLLSPASMSSAHFNRGPAYGLSAEVKNKVGLDGLPWPGHTVLPGQRPHSLDSLDPLLLIPCDLRGKRDKYAIGADFFSLLSIPETSAIVGGGVGGTQAATGKQRGSSIAKIPLDQDPLLTLCSHGALGENLFTFPIIPA